MSRFQSGDRSSGFVQGAVIVAGIVSVLIGGSVTGAQAPAPAAAAQAGAAPAGRAGGPAGPGANQFPGQTPVNAMIITGGCCHDYTGQTKIMMDTINAVMPVNWTVVQGMNSLPDPGLSLFNNPNWARGFDIVLHNECWANLNLSPQVVKNITEADVPRMFFHCALHSYRVMTDDRWRELIGATSRRHTQAHNVALKWTAGDPITAGLPPFVTPIDELYVIEKEWAPFKAIATAVSPEEGNPTFPVVWTHEYRGNRVFGTSFGHGNETFQANQFKELVTRGFRWALKRDPIALPPPPQPVRGGGAGRAGTAAPAAAPAPAGRGQ